MGPFVKVLWFVLVSIVLVPPETPHAEKPPTVEPKALTATISADIDQGEEGDDSSREGDDAEDSASSESDATAEPVATTMDEEDDSSRHGDEECDDIDDYEFDTTAAPPSQEVPVGRGANVAQKERGEFNRCAEKPYPCLSDHSCMMVNEKVVCYREQCNEERCNGKGECVETPNGFRCVCARGFEGRNCERIIETLPVCEPNPCKGDCKCHPSCQHELGYFCSSSGGFMGKNCTIRVPRVNCGQRSISIDIAQEFYTEFDKGMRNTYFYMAPTTKSLNKCTATNVGGSFRIDLPLPFSGCDTRKERSGNAVVIRNEVYVDRHSNLFSMAIPILAFECRYEREYKVVTSLQPTLSEPRLLKKNGRFVPRVELCKTPACPSACPKRYSVTEGAVYTVGEMIFLRATALPESGFGDFVTTVENAYISCNRQAVRSTSINLVDRGCAVATDLPSAVMIGRSVCVSFQTPRAQNCGQIFIHLHLVICKRNQLTDSACGGGVAQTCGVRRRRRSIDVFEVDDIFTVVGPLVIINGSDGEEATSIFPMAVLSDNALIYKSGRLVEVVEAPLNAAPNSTRTEGREDSMPTNTRLILATVIPVAVLVAVIFVLFLAYGPSPEVGGGAESSSRGSRLVSGSNSYVECESVCPECWTTAVDAATPPASVLTGSFFSFGSARKSGGDRGSVEDQCACGNKGAVGVSGKCLCSCMVCGKCLCPHCDCKSCQYCTCSHC